ncbi:MAG: flagellar assembly protein FliH [Burkholderiaceae bacterium]|nr:MAG: flagellar assembly protein FliH [Burkholderiaceae bacterium]TAM08713.1 MAG: flagellar assembly protein FliH [Pusillimonas sp.]
MSEQDSFDPLHRNGTAWRRWEMSNFEALQAQESKASNATAPLPDDIVSRLEEMGRVIRLKAQQAGHDEGYKTGHAKGYNVGKADGTTTGHQEGYDAGFQAGYAQGQGKAKAEAAQLAAIAASGALSLATMEGEVGQALINLAIGIARQVVRTTLEVHPEKILDTVRDILCMERGKDAVLTLRLHPEDLLLVREYIEEDPGAAKWRLIADPAVEHGGCVAETALGNIDATLQTRWQRVTSTLGESGTWERGK